MLFKTQRNKNNTLFWVIFFFAVLLLPIDGFPLGMSYLREFGARPSNFIILFLVYILFLFMLTSKRSPLIKIDKIILYISIILISLFFINILVAVFKEPINKVYYRDPLVSWILQYLMVLWMFLSIYIWLVLFRNIDLFSNNDKRFLSILAISSLFNIIYFVDDIIYLYFHDRIIPVSTVTRVNKLNVEALCSILPAMKF